MIPASNFKKNLIKQGYEFLLVERYHPGPVKNAALDAGRSEYASQLPSGPETDAEHPLSAKLEMA
ncbi:hypothetical protein [Pseudomonas cichorii]|uniref:Uncharacterized protein n=1 Tax=Pseudomonas cichorii TaxID=36746 RepID=A0ABQ1DVS9_PSECI|nr:hypothetical protein [Pseudomonas cichorii]QVE17870.1 hypothetical protein KGD89_03615 [Pseudomonas cichorii]GFM95087.1 hypothetical protein PSCICP_50590 [Pseudomonas cichorii]